MKLQNDQTITFTINEENTKFFATIIIEQTGFVLRETKDSDTREEAEQVAKLWIENKLRRDSK